MDCHFLLQEIFPAQGSNPHRLHWQMDSLPLSHQGSPVCIHRKDQMFLGTSLVIQWLRLRLLVQGCVWLQSLVGE